MKIFNKFKYVYHFIQGKNYLSEKNIVDALCEFNIAKIYNDNDYELYIYKGLSEFLLKEFENAMITYQYALNLIDKNKKLNFDAKQYLKKYILEDLLQIFQILQKYENIEKYSKLYNNLKFNKNNIKEKIFKDFPHSISP